MKKICTLHEIREAANERRSLICPSLHAWNRNTPAGFVLSLQGHLIAQMIDAGLYLYPKGGLRPKYLDPPWEVKAADKPAGVPGDALIE